MFVMGWMPVSFKFIRCNPSPHGVVLGVGALGRWLGHEGGVLTDGISALIKKTPRSSLVFSARWGTAWRQAVWATESVHWIRAAPIQSAGVAQWWSHRPMNQAQILFLDLHTLKIRLIFFLDFRITWSPWYMEHFLPAGLWSALLYSFHRCQL